MHLELPILCTDCTRKTVELTLLPTSDIFFSCLAHVYTTETSLL